MKLSIVMPVYNEKSTVGEIVRRVHPVETGLEKEIVVVDDCSTDGTRDILAAGPTDDVRVILHEKNTGQGRGPADGLRRSRRATSSLVQDADLEYDPASIPQLLAPILDGRADVVFGSRFLGGPHRVLFFWHSVGNRFLTCSPTLSNLNLTDMETCYKVFRREVLPTDQARNPGRFGFEPEITIKVARLRCRIYEVPISYSGRTTRRARRSAGRTVSPRSSTSPASGFLIRRGGSSIKGVELRTARQRNHKSS